MGASGTLSSHAGPGKTQQAIATRGRRALGLVALKESPCEDASRAEASDFVERVPRYEQVR
jgi:hypothetical protein